MTKRERHPDAEPQAQPHGGDEQPEQGDQLTQVEQLRAERDELEGRFKRALADFQNAQRRATIEQQQAREQGKISVIERLLPVLDQFDMALSQGLSGNDADAIAKGVRLIRDEMMRAVQSIGVTIVAPQANDEFDPSRHEAMTYQPVEGVEPGRVAATYRFGYVMGERLIRAAQVTLAADVTRDDANAGERTGKDLGTDEGSDSGSGED